MKVSRAAFETYLLKQSVRTFARRPDGAPVPLSFAQEAVWLHSAMAPGLPMYHESVVISYSGELDTGRFSTCLNTIALHHELWHSHIEEIEGVPQLVVSPEFHVPCEEMDISDLSGAVLEERRKQLTVNSATRHFHLGRGPLLRALVLKLERNHFQICLTLHHLIFDGVSLRQIFLQQLIALYSAAERGATEILPPENLHFADFSYWERRQGTARNNLSREYWRELLPAMAKFRLPTDRPRTTHTSCCGDVQFLEFGPEICAAVRGFARQEHTTVFAIVLASFAVLLARYTDEDKVVIGSMYGGRSHVELETVMGYFLNLLAFQIDLDQEPTFKELVARVAEVTLQAMTHATADVLRLERELGSERAAGEPLVQVVFTFQPELRDLPPEWDLDVFAVSNGTAKFDLHVELEEKRDSLVGRVIYNTDLFDAKTIESIVERWSMVLNAALNTPEKSIWQLPVLRAPQQAWLVNELNPRPAEFPGVTLHELFHRQAIRTPDRFAVACSGANLTYYELDRKSTALARRLRKSGCGAGTVIGVMVERTVDLLTVLLGILKAGAAYLPMDQTYPAARLKQMVSAADANLLITEPHLVSRLPRDHPPLLLDIEGASGTYADEEDMVACDAGEMLNRTAYLIFTSGSTGEPKGVEITHGGLTNLLWSMRQEPGIQPDDVLLAVTSICFDIAALELFLPLLVGARVELATTVEAADPELLRRRITESGATILQATPVTWRTLIESGWMGNCSLTALCGGEALTDNLAEQLLERTASVWNMYGPTETTIWSSCSRVRATSPIALGVPIANTSFFVLDAHQNFVPPGTAGELYIGGMGLARGYWKNPHLTMAKFPLVSLDGAPPLRLYRTGDRVRRLADGSLVFIGRLDKQIKLRGFRIELGEIEAILSQLPNVQDSIVVKCQQTPGSEVLAAYVIPELGGYPDLDVLRRELGRRLPAYMQPSSICVLHEVPLTPNGKLDRKRLPLPNVQQMRTQTAVPLPGLEQELASIWCEMLGINSIGRHDSFFDIGGTPFWGPAS